MILNRRVLTVMIMMAIMTSCLYTGVLSAQTEATFFSAYGSGPIQVRLYSDYFCPPCRALEPAVEPLLKNLLKKNSIHLIFVDVPFHKASALYARYFIYALAKKNDADHAMRVRNILFEAASRKDISTKEQIEQAFKKNGIAYAVVDPRESFERFNAMIKEDKVNATPTCVIITGGKKEKYVGMPDILNALMTLK